MHGCDLRLVRKGGSLGGLVFLPGGQYFFADRAGPPFQHSTQLAHSSAAPHRLHDLRVFPSGLKGRLLMRNRVIAAPEPAIIELMSHKQAHQCFRARDIRGVEHDAR
jgi:hypothetical protein